MTHYCRNIFIGVGHTCKSKKKLNPYEIQLNKTTLTNETNTNKQNNQKQNFKTMAKLQVSIPVYQAGTIPLRCAVPSINMHVRACEYMCVAQ